MFRSQSFIAVFTLILAHQSKRPSLRRQQLSERGEEQVYAMSDIWWETILCDQLLVQLWLLYYCGDATVVLYCTIVLLSVSKSCGIGYTWSTLVRDYFLSPGLVDLFCCTTYIIKRYTVLLKYLYSTVKALQSCGTWGTAVLWCFLSNQRPVFVTS